MGAISEIVEEPLSHDGLSARYQAICDDRQFANIQGKIELDPWGRILMSPATNFHGMLQARLSQRLAPLGGQAFAEASILTQLGLQVVDVAWASDEFMRAHGTETPFRSAPDLCIEIASPSNSRKELREKIEAYLAAGAKEAWIAFPQTTRFEFYWSGGQVDHTKFAIDLTAIFD